jgi:protein-disulfide isomerase
MIRKLALSSAQALAAIVLLAFAAPAMAQDIEINDMQMGNPDASVTVIEYASYTCPHCANFHKGPLKQIMSDYIGPGKINFIYREVYFDRYGLWASMIARCDEDRFFGISDLLYEGQRDWASGAPAEIADKLRKIGKVAGLEDEQLEACLTDGEKAQALVGWFQANTEADDISSTPSFIINGEKFSNMSYDAFSAILEEKLAE